MQQVPRWARHRLKDADLERIRRAVAKAESGTTGEFVPVIVRQSTGTGHLWPLHQVAFIGRLGTSPVDREELSFRRARLEFYQQGLEKTKGATGILLFVSLMERRAIVLADKGIAAKVPATAWQDVLDLLLKGIRDGDLAGGFEAALARAGDIVRPHFKARIKNKNELPDRLIIKE